MMDILEVIYTVGGNRLWHRISRSARLVCSWISMACCWIVHARSWIGFTMGILRVQFSDTIPLPINTVTIVGEGMILYMFGYGVIPKNIKLLCCPSLCQPHRNFHNFLHVLHPLHVLSLTKYRHMSETCDRGARRMVGEPGHVSGGASHVDTEINCAQPPLCNTNTYSSTPKII